MRLVTAAAAAIFGLALAEPSPTPSWSTSTTTTPSSASGLDPASPTFDGFDVDTNLPDGHYSITVYQNGSQHMRRWAPDEKRWHAMEKRQGTGEYTFLVDDAKGSVVDVAFDSYSKQRVPLPNPQTQCVHLRQYGPLNYPLIADDYRESKRALYNFCNVFKFVEGHVSMALNGNVMAYVCQRRATSLGRNTCAEAEYKAAEALMNKTCGDSAGYVWIKKWNKEYGRMWKGEKPCRRWGEFKPNWRKGPTFDDPKGRGKADRKEPKGDFKKTPEELYMEAAWEPVENAPEDDDGQRHDFRGQYGQFADGWEHGWSKPAHKPEDLPSTDQGMPMEKED